ncbi:MAG: hypothetical protein IJZ94_05030 [Clostridia bacterium]|nr:hypothetical protein [Clostridia bacterium]
MVHSYAEHGFFEIRDEKLIATGELASFVFKIKNNNKLVLIDNGNHEYKNPRRYGINVRHDLTSNNQ